MTKMKFDVELVSAVNLEIMDRIRLLLKLFPKEAGEHSILKNLEAASIHMTMFMKDVFEYIDDEKLGDIGEDEFLEKCGCNINELFNIKEVKK